MKMVLIEINNINYLLLFMFLLPDMWWDLRFCSFLSVTNNLYIKCFWGGSDAEKKCKEQKSWSCLYSMYNTVYYDININEFKRVFGNKKGAVQRYRVGIIERVKKEIDITIPEDVSEIGNYAFANNDLIDKIIIPSGVKK